MKIHTQPEVEAVFRRYPDFAREKLLELRDIILEAAGEIEEIQEVEETLKWGEPSYLVKTGSTVRIDWKEKPPSNMGSTSTARASWCPHFENDMQICSILRVTGRLFLSSMRSSLNPS
ncbi:MAG: DUF1801 domain-containing protein [Anaerolineales bacterium]|nr:DUF1801 domain-containing protein [Anaerolineales bacterium]